MLGGPLHGEPGPMSHYEGSPPQAGQRWAGYITFLAPFSSPKFLRSFPAWEVYHPFILI